MNKLRDEYKKVLLIKDVACMLPDRLRWKLIAKCFCTRFVVVYESLFHDQNVSLWSFSIFAGKLIQFLLNGALIHSATTNVMLIFHEFSQSYKKFQTALLHDSLRCTFHLQHGLLKENLQLRRSKFVFIFEVLPQTSRAAETDLKFWKQISCEYARMTYLWSAYGSWTLQSA